MGSLATIGAIVVASLGWSVGPVARADDPTTTVDAVTTTVVDASSTMPDSTGGAGASDTVEALTPTIPTTISPLGALPADAAGSASRTGPPMQLTPTLPPTTTTPPEPGDSYEIPADSGTGRRIVYSKGIMRIWMIEEDGTLFNTHRVSGRLDQPNYGTYAVWSRSEFTCSRSHSNICMRYMVRFAHSRSGDNIGFHEIPKRDGVPMQTLEQLGAPLSGGCVRQATSDAIITWNWAGLGTVVVVVP